jgi:type III restriction enzyme
MFFFDGQYKDKVIQVDSSMTGAQEDEMIQRLLDVENPEEPTEIVIHVNMLKEGWDVTNLYTIVPLRAANARILIEQSIGRGLRLPYGKRTGVSVVDRLSIVAHDRFQEIIDEANRPDSAIRLKQVILDPETDLQKMKTVLVQSNIMEQVIAPALKTASPEPSGIAVEPVFKNDTERKIAQATLDIVRNNYESNPSSKYLLKNEIQSKIAEEVFHYLGPAQQTLPGVADMPNVLDIVAKTTNLIVRQTIDIPRILVVPKGEVTIGFHPFNLDVSNVNYQPVERDLLIQHLRTHKQETLDYGGSYQTEHRLEDYLIRGLVDFDDISYDDHADLLYDLSGQMVAHLKSYLSEDDARNVLIYHQKQLSALIHVQMQEHQWEKATDYEVVVSKGFSELKSSAVTAAAKDPVADFRMPVQEKTKIAQMLFGGFARCLYAIQKYQSDTERRLSVILDRDSLKWFRPVKGQFQIFYKAGVENLEYVPDFVVEDESSVYMIETKARNEMEAAEVLSKKAAAVKWCALASKHAQENGGKPWKYLLIPHDSVSENMTLSGLAIHFA